MKLLAITSDSAAGLNAQVSGHFGAAAFFTLVTIDDDGKVGDIRSEANPHAQQHTPGAVPKFIRSLNANVIIAGGMGQRAQQIFTNLGMEVRAGKSGTVGNVIDAYLAGQLAEGAPCQHHDNGDGHGDGHGCGDGHGPAAN
ncbi:MAG: NifB/NifX family molybdenum-iron cluster-binding protein [Deltaproteobacteria bacterium]|nr:NifB/NifX family molybdenum-iron cluster-binding protein [Deltaproteobacteria bacterium]